MHKQSPTLTLIRKHLRAPVTGFLLAAFSVWSTQVHGASFYWDSDTNATGNNAGTGAGLGGSGIWNTTNLNWWDGVAASDQAWPNAIGDMAIFGGAAGIVTLGEPLNVNNLTFNSSGYTVTGTATNILSLTGTTPGVTFDTGVSNATISAVIAGSAGLAFNGGTSSGTLILSGANANTYTGTTSISSGTLQMRSLTALGASGAGNTTNVSSGGALRVSLGGTVALEQMTLAGTGVSGGGALVVDPGLASASVWTGAITIGATGATINTGLNSTFNQTTTGMAVTGSLTKTGAGTLGIQSTTTGTGTLDINGGVVSMNGSGRWASGTISVNSGGTLQNTGAGTDSIGNGVAINVASGGVLDFQETGATETIGALTLNGTGLNGTGAFINNAAAAAVGGTITATSITLASNTTIGATLAGSSLKLLTPITGAGFTLTKVGLGTIISTDTTTATKPFGDGSIVLQEGTLSLTPSTGIVALSGANAAAGSNFAYSGGGTFALTKGGATSLSYTVGNGTTPTSELVRSGKGTLVIAPTLLTNLGLAAAFEDFVVNGLTTTANKNGAATGAGIYDASVVAVAANVGTFLSYGTGAGGTAGGFAPAAYNARTAAVVIPANEITDVTGSFTATTLSNPYALRVGAGFTLTNGGTTTVNGVAASSTNSGIGGVILNTATAATITGGILDFGASEGTIFVSSTAASGTIASQINGSAGITKFGPGTLVLSSTASSFTGGVNINQGTLSVAADTNLGAAANGIIFNGAANLTLTASATFARGITLNNNAPATITITTTSGTDTISGAVTGSGGLSLIGTTTLATLTLSNTANTFTGPVRVGSVAVPGVLVVSSLADSANPIRLGGTTGAGTFTWATTALTALTLNSRQIDLSGTTGGGVIDNSNATAANAITINTDLIVSGVGNKTLTFQGANAGANTFAGRISDGTGAGSVIGITKGGTGNWTLSNTDNTFSGIITLAASTTGAGTLSFASAGIAAGVTFSGTTGAATLKYTGAGQTMSGAVSLSAVTTGTQTIDASGTGALNLSSTTAIPVGAGAKTLALTGTNAGANTIAGIIQDNSGVNTTSVTKSGTGTWVLANANTNTGATTVSNGVLQLGNALAVQNSTVTVNSNNGVAFSSGITNFTLGNLSGSGNLALADVAAAAVNLTIGGNNASPAAYSGTLSGSGNLTKTGTGTTTLSGASNTNSGAITVNGGILSVSSSTVSAVTGITVGSTTSSVLDLYADGVGVTTNLATNTSIALGGTSSAGRLGFQLGTSSDQLVFSGTGALSINAGGGLVNASAVTGFGAGSYTLISGAAAITGAPTLGSLPGGFGYSLTTGASSIILNVTAATGTDFYWAGDVNGSWTGFGSGGTDTNWSTSALATTPDAGASPGTGQIVNFSASTGAANFSTTLDNAFSIAGLKFLNAGSAVTIAAGTGGTLQIGASGIDVQTGAPVPTISAPLIIGTAQTWNVADAASVLTIGGPVSGGLASSNQASPGSNTSLTITGPGAVSFGSAANTFTGDIVVDGGGFNVDNLNDWGLATVNATTSKTITLINGGRLNVNASLNPGTNATTSYDLIQIGTGGGTVNTGSGFTLTLDDAGQLYGSGALTKTGVGILVLRNQTTFAGTIDITAGTVQAGGTGVFGVNTAGTSVQSGAAFNLNGVTLTETEPLTIYGTGLASAPAGVITNSSATAAVFPGSITLGADSAIGPTAAGGITLSGSVSGPFSLTIKNAAAGGTTLSGASVNNGGTITNSGAGVGATLITGNIGSSVTGVVQNSATSPLTLSGTNSFTGGVTLTQGTLNINSPTALGSGLFAISSGTTINNSSAGAVVTTTNPTQTWDGNFTFTGTQALDLGTGAVSLGTSAGTDRTITTTASTLTVGGVISDGTTATSLIKAGAGTLVLGGANTYSGATAISGGILSISSSGNLGNNSATNTISIAGSTLRNTGASVTLGVNRSITLGAGGGTIDVTGANSLTVNGVVSGGNPLAKTGTGTLVLSNTGNSINSTVTINGGTLSAHPSVLTSATSISVGPTASGTLDLYADGVAATTTLTGTSITLGGAASSGRLGFQLGASGTSDQLVFGGAALTIAAGGGLINGTALSGFGAGTWTLVSGAAITGTPTLGSLPGGFAYTLTTGASTIVLTATAATGTNYYWAGDVNASWTGLASGGTNTNWSTSATAITPDAGATPGAGQTVNFSVSTGAANFSTTLDNNFSVAGINFLAAGSAVTIAAGAGGTLQLGTGGISVATAASAPTISAPVILGANNTWTVTDATTTLTVTGDVSETGGARTLTKAGAGTLLLGGANSYSGLTTVSVGVLNIQNSTALGTTAAGTTVTSGAALQIQGGITVGAEALTLVGTGIGTTGALRNISGNNTWGGLITMTTPGTRINSDSGTLTIDVASGNAVAGTGFALTIGGAGNGSILDPVATGASGTVIKDGAGTWTFGPAAANNYTGVTTISGGALNIQNATGLGTTAAGTTIAAGGTLELQGTIAVGAELLTSVNGSGLANGGAIRNISGNNSLGGLITMVTPGARINSDSGTLTLDVASGSAVAGTGFALTLGGAGSGVIKDPVGTGTAGSVIKDGAGTWTFSPAAVNTYTGGTIVNKGTLTVDFASIATATNIINSGSVLTLGGGTLNVLGKASAVTSQTFASTTLTAGSYSVISANKGAATGLTVDMKALTRNVNSGLNFDLTAAPVVTLTGTTMTNGILTGGANGPAYATFNKSDWATMSGSNPVAYAGYVTDTYTGATDNVNVTLAAQSPAAFSVNTLKLNNGAQTLTLSGTNTLNAGGILIGSAAGAVTIGGTGTLSGIANAAANGELNIFQHSASPAILSASVVNNTAGTSYLAATPVGTTFNKQGAGTLVLTSTKNAWTGGTNVAGGVLQLGAANVIPDGVVNPGLFGISAGGTFDLNGFNEVINGLSGAGIVDNTSSTPVTLFVGNGTLAASATSTFSGNIQNSGGGALSLIKTGTGTLTLSNPSTYTGSTTIAQGTLALTLSLATGPISNLLPANTPLTLGSGTLTITGRTAATGNNSFPTFGGTTLNGGGTITMAGSTSGLTALSLGALSRSAGTGGSLNITGLSAFLTVGTTTPNNSAGILGGHVTVAGVDWGTVNASGNIVAYAAYTGALPAGTTTAVDSNYTLAAAQTQTGSSTINSLKLTGTTYILTQGANNILFSGANGGIVSSGTAPSITGTGTIGAGAGNEFLVFVNSGTLTINSIVAGGGLTKSGAGTLSLKVSANTYTGQTVINGGVLNIDADARVLTSSGITLNGGTLTHGDNFNMTRAITLGLAGGTLNYGPFDGGGGWSSTTAVAFVGSGPRTLTLGGDTDQDIATFVPALGDGGGPTSLVVAGGTDDSIFALSGASTYSGSTTFSRGVLRLLNTSAIGGGQTSAATVGNFIFTATGVNRAVLELNTTSGTFSRSLGYGAGQMHWEGNGGFSNSSTTTQIVNLGGSGAKVTWGTGGFVPTGNRLQFGNFLANSNFSQGAVDFQNAIELGTSLRIIDAIRANGTTTDRTSAILDGILSGNITSGAGGGLDKQNTGTLLLTGANSGGAATVTVTAGTLYFSSMSAIPGSGANITLSSAAGTVAAFGVPGDTNPMSTLGNRIANPNTSTAAFLLSADSSATLDFTSYPNMRLSAMAFQNTSTIPVPLAHATTFTGSIIQANNTYNLGGQAPVNGITNSAASTLVLARTNMLTGTSAVNLTYGETTLTASNNYTGGTVINGNNVTMPVIGIGNDAAFGTGLITLAGTKQINFGAVNGDHTLGNNIAFDGGSTFTQWTAGSDGTNDSILANTNQGTTSYLGTIDLGGRAFPIITGRIRGTLFMGDITGGSAGISYTQSAGGYFSFLSTSANGGVPKTYTGTTQMGDNTILVIDSDSSLGGSGNIQFAGATGSNIQLQPGTGSVTLAAGRALPINATGIAIFGTPAGSTLTIPGIISGATTGSVVKAGLGTLILQGDNTNAVTTGPLVVRAGTLRLDAATLGATVWGATGQSLTLGVASGTFSSGGTLEITGTFPQAFGGVTVNARSNNINLTGAMTLTLGAITRTTGSTLNFSSPTGTVVYTTAGNAGLVNGATTWNNNDWAKADSANISQFTAYNALTGTASAPTITTNAAFNYILNSTTTNDVTLAVAGTLALPNNANTLKYSDPAARTIDLRSGGTAGFLRLGTGGAAAGGVTNAGGILIASGAGALTIGAAPGATGGSIMAGGTTTNTLGDLVIINNSTSDVTINSAIINNNGTTGTTPVVYNGLSTGKLILAGANTFTGAIIINNGLLEVASVNSVATAGPLGQGTAAAGNILLNGGTFRANLAANGATDKGFTVNAPSTIEVVANTLTLNTTVLGVAGATAQHITMNAGLLKKTGAGTLELKNLATNANNANLSIEVAAGTLLLNKTSTATISAVDLAGGAALIIDSVAAGSAPTVVISGTGGNQISDISSVLVKGDQAVKGVLDLNGLNETIDGLAGTGVVTSNVAGTSTLTVGGNNSAGLAPYTLASASAGVNGTGLNHFGGVIQDGGVGKVVALTKTGSGTQILAGANTYSGATTINGGTLKLAAVNALPSGAGKGDITIAGTNTGVAIGGSGLVLAPGTLDMGGFNQAINGLNSSSGGFVTNNPGLTWNGSAWVAAASTNNLTVGNNDATASFSGVIQDGFTVAPGVSATGYIGKINLVKTGTAAQTLTGANLFSGTTAIQNGSIIVAGGSNRLPSTTTVTLGNLTDNGVLQVGNGTGAISQTIAGLSTSGSGAGNTVVGGNAANSTLILNQAGTAIYSGKFGGAGANENHLNVTLQGGGTLTLTGTNTHTGTTTVQGGSTLILGTNITSSPVTVGGVGAGTLTGTAFSVGGLVTVNAGGIVAPGATPSAIGTLNFTNGLAMNGGTLAFQLGSTSGSAPLIGDSINLTGGTFNVASGFISLSDIGGANGIILGTYNLLNYTGSGGLSSLNFNNLSLTSNVIGANNYVATLFNNTALNILQVIIDNARFWSAQTNGVWDTNGTANWTPGNFFLAGDKVIFADTFPPSTAPGTTDVQLNSSVAPGAVTFTNSTLTYTLSGTGAITGSTGISKSGTGSVVIDLANTFTGNTSITNGSIEMRRASALGTNAGSVSVSGGGELRLSGGIAVGAKALTLNGTGASNTGALRNLSGNNSYAGAITLNGASRINSDAGTLALTGGITMGTNNLAFGGAGNITESGIIGGAGSLTVDGTGTVTLSNTNTYTGQTFIKNGTLGVSSIGSVGVAGGLGNVPDTATGTIAIGSAGNTGTLKWSGSSNETTDRVVDLAGTTGGAVLDASGTSGAVLDFSSPLTFTGAGSKTLTLTGTGGSVGAPNVIAGAINDPATFVTSLLKTGAGVWRLDGMNGYTGSTTINGGTLLLGVAGGLPVTAPTIANASSSATLHLNGLSQMLNGIDFGGAGATSTAQGIVAIGSAGTLTLGGNVTYSASGNPLGASITGSGSATLDLNGAARTFNIASSSSSGGADLTISAVVADAAAGGSLVKTGAGTLVLTGANTYMGATTVNGGVLSTTPAALGSTSAINVGTTASAELNLYADNSAAPVTLAADTDLNIGGAASTGFLGFQLAGTSSSDSISLAGTGALTLGAAGGLVNARALGTLTGPKYLLLDTTNTGPSSIAINTASGFSLGVLPGGYSYSLDNTTNIGKLYLSVSAAAGGSYYWTGNRTTDSWAQLANGGTTSNWSTNQAGTVDAGATPGGVPVIFSADNAGAAAINTTLDQPYSISSLQFIGNTPATGNVSIAAGAGNGTLTVGAGGIDVQTNASSTTTTISAPVILGAAQSWNVTDAGQTLTVSGVISANNRLLTKLGAGTLVLSGANTFNGGTAINGGTVQINSASSLGATSGISTINNATLQATADITESRSFVLGHASSAISVNATKTLAIINTATSNISGTGVLNATGAGTLTLDDTANANTFSNGSILGGGGTVKITTGTSLGSGPITIGAATLQALNTITNTGRNYTLSNAASALKVDSGKTYTISNSGSSKITGAGVLNTTGAGTVVLNDSANANDFNGGSVLGGGGKVKIGTNTALGSGSITINAATLESTATLTDTSRNYTLGSAASTLTVGSGTTYTITNGAATKITGAGALNANGPGTLVLDDSANANDFSGGSVLSGLGIVKITTATSLGANSGTATIKDATLQATADISSSRNFILASYGSTISVDATKTYALSGLLSDGTPIGTLNKTGAGILTLGRAAGNSYTGGTFVTAGTLLAGNTSGSATGTGAVSVTGSGSTLGGTGIIGGAVTIASGAVLSPASATTAGTLTLGGLTLASGSALNYQLGAPAGSDKTVVTGSNSFTANGGLFTIDASTLAGFTNGTYNLITYSGTLGGSFSNLSLNSSLATDSLGNKYFVRLANNTGSVDLVSTNSLVWNGNKPGTVWDSGATANTNWKSGATTNLNFYDTMVAAFDDTASTFTVNVDAAGVAPSSVTVNAANDYTFQGTGAITGTTGLAKSGAGQLTIANANSFSGNTTLSAGAIEMQDPAALGTTGNIAITPGASLRLNSASPINLGTRITSYSGGNVIENVSGNNSATLPAFTLVSATSFVSDAGTLTLAGNITTNALAVSLIGNGGNFVLTGTTISGSNFNFTANMTGGTATIANNINVGTSAVVVNGTGTTTFNGTITSTSTGAGLNVSNAGTNNFNGNVTVSGTNGGIALAGATTNTFGAATNVLWNGTGTLNVSSSNDSTFNGTISGSGLLNKSGAGTLTFAASSNSYSGTATLFGITAGSSYGNVLTLANNALGTGPVTASFNTGVLSAQLQLSGGITLGNSAFTLTGAGSDGAGTDGIIRSLVGANAINGNITMALAGGNTTLRADTGSSLTLNGVISANTAGRSLILNGGGDFNITNTITQGSGTAGSPTALVVSNSGTTTISSTNSTYTGPTTVSNGATLNVAALAAINTISSIGTGSAAGSSADLLLNNGTVQYTGGTAQSTDRLFSVGASGGTLDASGSVPAATLNFTGSGAMGFGGSTAARALTLTGSNTGANRLALVIGDNTGATSLNKTGTGTWVLTGTNTYSGGTTITNGTLLVNNTAGSGTGSGAVAATGGALGGSGTITGDTTISGTGLLTPGTNGTADTLTFDGSLTLASAGSATTRALMDVSAATGNELSYALANGSSWWSTYNGAFLTGNGGSANDLVRMTGGTGTPQLNFGTNSQVAFNLTAPVTWHLGDVLNLFDWSGLVAVNGNTLNPGSHLDLNGLGTLDAGLSWDTSRFLTTGAVAVVPEPGRVLLLLLGFLGLAFRRRRASAE